MDLAACAKRVFIILRHHRRRCPAPGENCALPVTARGVVKLVATNYGLFAPKATGSGCSNASGSALTPSAPPPAVGCTLPPD
jgi:acyl CoA:acetate/3-ketoacid CoA transferase beta subunit